jgi:hypothetical protein
MEWIWLCAAQLELEDLGRVITWPAETDPQPSRTMAVDYVER